MNVWVTRTNATCVVAYPIPVTMTLRSGRQDTQPIPPPINEQEIGVNSKESEKVVSSENEPNKGASKDLNGKHKRLIIRESVYEHLTPPPFPSALWGNKKEGKLSNIYEVCKQVKVNIPLVEMIK